MVRFQRKNVVEIVTLAEGQVLLRREILAGDHAFQGILEAYLWQNPERVGDYSRTQKYVRVIGSTISRNISGRAHVP